MAYFLSKRLACTFEEALPKVAAALAHEGFGVLTEIDIKETLKRKLGVDFRKYRILGACNPPFAHRALTAEPNVGLLLPCNVVIQEMEGEGPAVSSIDPVSAMQGIGNPELAEVASEVRQKLEKALAALS